MSVQHIDGKADEGKRMRMEKWTHRGSTPSAHPGDEEIAAYIDCGLKPAARRRLAAHLSACDACFEVYLETLHCLHPAAAVPARDAVVPFTRRSPAAARWSTAATAAALLVAAGLGGVHLLAGRPRMDAMALVRTLGGGDGLAENVWTGEVLRSGFDDEEQEPTDFDALSFLMGAHLVGFQATVEAQDQEAACAAAGRVVGVLVRAEFVATAASEFKQATGALCRQSATRSWTGLVERTSPVIEEAFRPVHLDFGEWAQAGRIAARAERSVFFERRTNRRFLEWLLEQREEKIDDKALGHLRSIDSIWRMGPRGAGDFRRLADAFTAILDRYEALLRSEGGFS